MEERTGARSQQHTAVPRPSELFGPSMRGGKPKALNCSMRTRRQADLRNQLGLGETGPNQRLQFTARSRRDLKSITTTDLAETEP